MSSPRKSPFHYPRELSAALASASRIPICIHFPSLAAARRFRRHFYSFRESLYTHPDLLPVLTLIAPHIRSFIAKNEDGTATLCLKLDRHRLEEQAQ